MFTFAGYARALAAAAIVVAAPLWVNTAAADAPVPTTPVATPIVIERADIAIAAAHELIGTPYHYTGSTPATGFDCSGFTSWVWAQAGVTLPHNSSAQRGAIPAISRAELAPGDLVFWPGHVAMYIGDGLIIHAPGTGQRVRVDSIDYWTPPIGYGRMS